MQLQLLVLILFLCGCNKQNIEIREKIDKDGYKHIGQYESNLKNGIYKIYSPSNKLLRVLKYKGDLQDGGDTSYYENGQIQSTSFFINGVQEGESKKYFEDGKVFEIAYYINGNLNGISYLFNRKGVLTDQIRLINGKRSGFSYEFNDNGNLTKVREYIIIKDESELNQLLSFDNEGYLINNFSRFLQISTSMDSIQWGNEYQMEINFTKLYKQAKIYIGDYDLDFTCHNCKSDTFEVTSLPYKIKIKSHKIGRNEIKGIVDVYQYSTSPYEGIIHQYFYFTKTFFVY